jgi:hypothetical protein
MTQISQRSTNGVACVNTCVEQQNVFNRHKHSAQTLNPIFCFYFVSDSCDSWLKFLLRIGHEIKEVRVGLVSCFTALFNCD